MTPEDSSKVESLQAQITLISTVFDLSAEEAGDKLLEIAEKGFFLYTEDDLQRDVQFLVFATFDKMKDLASSKNKQAEFTDENLDTQ